MSDNPKNLKEQLDKYSQTLESRRKYIKNEFQSYGLDLAKELDDWKNRSLYIRLAKNVDRKILDQARYFVKDQDKSKLKTPYKLFMWKLKELRKNKKTV